MLLKAPLVFLLDGLFNSGPLGRRSASIPASQAGCGIHEESTRGSRPGAAHAPHPLLVVAQEGIQRAQLLLQALSPSNVTQVMQAGQSCIMDCSLLKKSTVTPRHGCSGVASLRDDSTLVHCCKAHIGLAAEALGQLLVQGLRSDYA